MFNKSRKKYFLNSFFVFLLVGIGVLTSMFFVNYVSAGQFNETTKSGDNFDGWAWSENYGWISFNNYNCTIAGCPTGAAIDYGVDVRYRDGRVRGYAWSPNIGWVYFPDTATGVTFDKNTGTFSGTAKVYVYESSGMGDLRFKNIEPLPASTAAFNVYTVNNQLDANYGKLNGWAWNGNGPSAPVQGVGIGWLSFNSTDAGAGGTAYHVYVNLNHTPIVSNHQLWRITPDPDEQIIPGGPAVISVGDTAEFRADWLNADDANWLSADQGDKVRMFACKTLAAATISPIFDGLTNQAVTGLDTLTCNGGAANTWCSSPVAVSAEGQISCQRPSMLASDGVGVGKHYYTTVCDEFGYCSSPVTSGAFLLNDQPLAGPITSFGPPDYLLPGDPPTTGPGGLPLVTTPPLTADDPYGHHNDHEMTFVSGWNDTYTNNRMTMYVCSSDSFIRTHDDQHCGERTWCESPETNVAAAVNGTLQCMGSLDGSETPGANTYYVYMCDGYGACTVTPEEADFFINHRPSVLNGMSAPNWNASQAATNPPNESDLQATLKWGLTDLDGAVLSDTYVKFLKYDNTLVFDGLASADTPVSDSIGTGVASVCSSPSTCSLTIKDRDMGPRHKLETLEWNTSYKWGVRVRDAYAWSEVPVTLERYFDTADTGKLTDDVNGDHYGNYGVSPTEASNEYINSHAVNGGSNTFTTYKHNFPVVNHDGLLSFPLPGITYFPAIPSANEETKVTPHGYCYPDNRPSQADNTPAKILNASEPCDELSLDCTYDWNTLDANVAQLKITFSPASWGTVLNNTDDYAIIRFKKEGDHTLNKYILSIHDKDGYFNSNENATPGYVNEQLPSWQEVK